MDSKRLEDVLTKYWACESTLEEEQELRSYLLTEEGARAHPDAAVLFRYFEEQKLAQANLSFNPQLRPVHAGSTASSRVRSLVYTSMRIAAGVAVLAAAVYLVRQELREPGEDVATTTEFADTYDDPKVAYKETKKALMMISKGFGRAEQQARKINLLNEAQEKIKTKTEEKEL
jgi:hypothetical protein